MILLVKPLTEDRRIPCLGMNHLAARLGSKSLKHPSSTHPHWKPIKSVNPVQSHGKIAGHIKPKRSILFLPGGGIAPRKLIKKGSDLDETEEIGLNHFAGRLTLYVYKYNSIQILKQNLRKK